MFKPIRSVVEKIVKFAHICILMCSLRLVLSFLSWPLLKLFAVSLGFTNRTLHTRWAQKENSWLLYGRIFKVVRVSYLLFFDSFWFCCYNKWQKVVLTNIVLQILLIFFLEKLWCYYCLTYFFALPYIDVGMTKLGEIYWRCFLVLQISWPSNKCF